jgi:hypothetical protein
MLEAWERFGVRNASSARARVKGEKRTDTLVFKISQMLVRLERCQS